MLQMYLKGLCFFFNYIWKVSSVCVTNKEEDTKRIVIFITFDKLDSNVTHEEKVICCQHATTCNIMVLLSLT